jgi:hypothetical protein
VGPILRCRLNLAVLWEWDPVTRRTWSISRLGVGLLVVGLALTTSSPLGGAVVVGTVLVSAALEAVVLTRLTSGAVARTTRAVRDTG